MHSSHLASILGVIEHTKNLIGTRLLPASEVLTARVQPTPRSIAFAQAVTGTFQPIAEEAIWGRDMDEAWFHLTGTVPAAWAGSAVVAWVDLGTEAMAYDRQGVVLNSLNSGGAFDGTSWKNARPFIPLLGRCNGTEAVELYLHASCFSHPGAVDNSGPMPGTLVPAGMPLGRVSRVRVARFDQAVWELYYDVEVLANLQGVLPANSARRAKIVAALRACCEAFLRSGDITTCRDLLRPVLAAHANASALTAVAVGHGHLDTAWLWPLPTSRMKFARTASNQLHLIERFPGYVFGASSAAHYQWLKEDHPALFAKVATAISAGTWEILGTTYVEPDCLVPSGESLVRQCLYGARYFTSAYGRTPSYVWLPDTFGFGSGLPQILRHCGCDTLITTKIAWNNCNRPRHHSFRWRGIDGSEVAVHFPPDGSYESTLLPDALLSGEENYGEKAELDRFLVSFGHGDGGGGPHERHLMRGARSRDLEGVPRVEYGTAASFQAYLQRHWQRLPVLSDELYLEQHQGTLTTHGDIKLRNRRLEQALAGVECLLAHGPASAWPQEAFERMWKTLLLRQFHDILPGTSIRAVYDEALPALDAARDECLALARAFAQATCPAEPGSWLLFNSLSLPWEGVVTLPPALHGMGVVDQHGVSHPTQQEGRLTVAWLRIPAQGFLRLRGAGAAVDAALRAPQAPVLRNEHVHAVFDPATGLLTSLGDLLPPQATANEFRLYADHPAQWDAWNLELDYRNRPAATARCTACALTVSGPVRETVLLNLTLGDSTIVQAISLPRHGRRIDFVTTIDWRECHRFLRVAFPTAIDAPQAAYQIQHGWIGRPTHPLNEATTARIEYAAHTFVDLSEPGRGLALLNDCKYGHIVDGATLELGLLRSPIFPDPLADRGLNHVTYALLTHADGFPSAAVFAAADGLNRPPLELGAFGLPQPALAPALSLMTPTIALETIKRAEAGTGWIVRLSNRMGLPAMAQLRAPRAGRLLPCNGLEAALGPALPEASSWALPMRPFEVQTWLLSD